jgi:hypothetical protein
VHDAFEVIGRIQNPQTFAVGDKIRELDRLVDNYGQGRWLKRKGIATVRLADGTLHRAEVHWYEAHGIGKKELKIKQLLS